MLLLSLYANTLIEEKNVTANVSKKHMVIITATTFLSIVMIFVDAISNFDYFFYYPLQSIAYYIIFLYTSGYLLLYAFEIDLLIVILKFISELTVMIIKKHESSLNINQVINLHSKAVEICDTISKVSGPHLGIMLGFYFFVFIMLEYNVIYDASTDFKSFDLSTYLWNIIYILSFMTIIYYCDALMREVCG